MDFESILGKNCKKGELLKEHTTFRVGGECKFFLTPVTEEELRLCMEIIKKENMKYYILGKGSNILADDRGYDGVIISTVCLNNKISHDKDIIEAGAGLGLEKVSAYAMEAGLSGFEFACGIPGTLGGAIVMNAGAYGGELSHVLTEVKVLCPDGSIKWKKKCELELGYRKSNILENKEIVLAARLKLTYGDREKIKATVIDLNNRRKEKQPLEYPSAGSTFKRPEGYFAGKLIDDAGLRGFRLGGAAVSSKHCGFVINYDNATSRDVKDLIQYVKDSVYEKFGVKLECEVRMI